jgi:two-component system, LytTR family, response regulator
MSQPIPTFIVDDEPLSCRRLQRLLRADPQLHIAGTFESATEAAAHARDLLPRLLLLDIRMPELDGFQLLSALASQGLNPYVIFVTAHPDRSLDAFTVGAVDYVLKPFGAQRLGRALARAKTLITAMNTPVAGAVPTLAEDSPRLFLAQRGKVVVLAMRDVEFAQAAARHVKVYAGGRCYVCNQSLGELEGRLSPASFVRIHRSTVINVQHMVEMHPSFHGDYEVVLRRGTRLTLSRRYRERLMPFFLGKT